MDRGLSRFGLGGIRGYFCCNPVFYLQQAGGDITGQERYEFTELLEAVFARPVWGCAELIEENWPRSMRSLRSGVTVHCKLPRHVIPVWIIGDEGCIVPITCERSEEWDATDACTRFRPANEENPLAGLNSLLVMLERTWARIAGSPLPLRWRCAYSLMIPVPVHAGDIAGDSLELPIAVMLLREACAAFTKVMPFGDGPVFCTGPITADGSFDGAENVRRKLEGFQRELGRNRVAILSGEQRKKLGEKVLEGMEVHEASNLEALLRLEPFQEGLRRLAGPPRPTEIDHLARLMTRLERGIRFSDALSLSEYLLRHAETPPYKLTVLTQTAHLLLHEGRIDVARSCLDDGKALVKRRGDDLGASQRAHFHAVRAAYLLDCGEPRKAFEELEEASPYLESCSHPVRIEVRGIRSQAHRALGAFQAARREARAAVKAAKQGYASETGRDLNYLCHALIREAESMPPEKRRKSLNRARAFLKESMGQWAPAEAGRSRLHQLFCKHYQAEIDRLEGVASDPGEPPEKLRRNWRHPWFFTLLSCVRNPANGLDARKAWAKRLVDESRIAAYDGVPDRRMVFELFHGAYDVLCQALHEEDTGASRDALATWCLAAAPKGAGGWNGILGPILAEMPSATEERIAWADRLCAAIYFH